ncbi:glutamine--fructose-6-phosphate transaminase (isomerizing) [Natronoflexus pectinivorans]|uniref:Glutamine--fructose-6-phosphate aminotransferase [isomerizing] n=1 Tax=Natronoflexus pectinivorans TaxID=682526 RepID=A0A4V2RWK3_9BACT|nr:glutamine--fructose-6-phosphate transaminase (isomerizing) [Natronoflexus pectinivorans]TCO08868.1 glucosamine--fructose-6-phosphate aminotransferase (isomerizing) [Natronoflexus pectinivorans]
MCGIVAYVGDRTAYPILIKGLQRLEYRGYDSAGIALLNGQTNVYKCKGKVKDLQALSKDKEISGTVGMGHTRWATHGEPSDHNAHPHRSMNGKFFVVHNGIIENYTHLKKELSNRGYKFQSETDTEVLANLIENIYLEKSVSAELAVRLALTKVVGAYGLVISCEDEPGMLIAARKGSPLVVGVGEHEYFLASDATPIVEYTDQVMYLNDEEVAVITRDGLDLKNLENDSKTPDFKKITLSIDHIDKGDYEHFMLKEIHEQPMSIRDTFRGRVAMDESKIFLGGVLDIMPQLIKAKRIIIVACGTSWHAGLVGEYLFEKYGRIPVEVEYASEFRYRDPIIQEDDLVIAISQSGETADTLAAIRKVRETGATILGICNVAGSSIARETDAGVYTHAGIEIGVASTKAFTSQITVLTMMALLLGSKRQVLPASEYKELIHELIQVPSKIEEILKQESEIEKIAAVYKDVTNALYMGRGILFPVALEGALKLKEISYIHAEGYPAAEMKHGPIALIDENMPVFALAANDQSYEKMVSNIQEVKARKGKVIAIATKGDKGIRKMADHVIEIPECHEAVSPLLAVVPLQILSYHIAVMRGCNVDQPRNLAKSVTVE